MTDRKENTWGSSGVKPGVLEEEGDGARLLCPSSLDVVGGVRRSGHGGGMSGELKQVTGAVR